MIVSGEKQKNEGTEQGSERFSCDDNTHTPIEEQINSSTSKYSSKCLSEEVGSQPVSVRSSGLAFDAQIRRFLLYHSAVQHVHTGAHRTQIIRTPGATMCLVFASGSRQMSLTYHVYEAHSHTSNWERK